MNTEHGELLLVDDDEDSRDLLSRRLVHKGHHVESAETGAQALALLEKRDFDLVLLDVDMPGLNGLDTLRAIRETHETTKLPVIMVTAHDESDEVVRALDMGANDYIPKPIDLPVALARIRTQILVKRAMEALEEVNERLRRLATVDSLTGIANRRRFDEVLESEWKRAIRDASPLAVLMADVDYFKKYNDTYGHDVGDKVLRQVAEALSGGLRPGDFVARYGGEEFVLVLPLTEAEGALAVAERLRAAVAATEVTHGDGQTSSRVTICIGVATGIASRTAAPQPLVTLADGALYEAKRAGRNRVQLARTEEIHPGKS